MAVAVESRPTQCGGVTPETPCTRKARADARAEEVGAGGFEATRHLRAAKSITFDAAAQALFGAGANRASCIYLADTLKIQFVVFLSMKLLIVSIISWLLGIGAYLLSLYAFYGGKIGAADLTAVLYWSAIASALAFPLIYAPVMFLLRRLFGGCKPTFVFPLIASLMFVIPAMLIMLAFGGGADILKTLFSPEAFLFYGMFFAVGVSFGLGFVWSYRGAPPHNSFQPTPR